MTQDAQVNNNKASLIAHGLRLAETVVCVVLVVHSLKPIPAFIREMRASRLVPGSV
jgi:hypothetical protein